MAKQTVEQHQQAERVLGLFTHCQEIDCHEPTTVAHLLRYEDGSVNGWQATCLEHAAGWRSLEADRFESSAMAS